jgi:hypothetical protein
VQRLAIRRRSHCAQAVPALFSFATIYTRTVEVTATVRGLQNVNSLRQSAVAGVLVLTQAQHAYVVEACSEAAGAQRDVSTSQVLFAQCERPQQISITRILHPYVFQLA